MSEWALPRPRASFTFKEGGKVNDAADDEAYDIKFYPYNPKEADPVFAVVSKKHILVVRIVQVERGTNPCQFLRVIKDDDPDGQNCACCWSKDPETDEPWLCVAGHDAKIKIYNIRSGQLVRTLVGHGDDVDDLATCPTNPWLIASASHDTTVRLWNLQTAYEKQPCVCILAGEGHSWDLLSVSWHQGGRYILSAGHDQVICLWMVPVLPSEHTERPVVVHYPHFWTSEVHCGLIDCVAFYGDLILSKACQEQMIVLWKIEGFSSTLPPSSCPAAPSNHDTSKTTRSAYVPSTSARCPKQWTRLLQFSCKKCGPVFFMRFSMYQSDDRHPVLAFCNADSTMLYWDMARLTSYQEYVTAAAHADKVEGVVVERPSWLIPIGRLKNPVKLEAKANKAAGNAVNTSSKAEDPYGILGLYTRQTLSHWAGKYDTRYAHGVLQPHATQPLPKNKGSIPMIGRQVAWSPDGSCCVVSGSQHMVVVLQRWQPGDDDDADDNNRSDRHREQTGSSSIVTGGSARGSSTTLIR